MAWNFRLGFGGRQARALANECRPHYHAVYLVFYQSIIVRRPILLAACCSEAIARMMIARLVHDCEEHEDAYYIEELNVTTEDDL